MLRVLDFADENALLAVLRQVRGDLVEFVHDADIELRRPVAVRAARYRMPVVAGLEIDEDRRLARRMDDIGQRQARQRRPADEMGVGAERVRIVVEKGELRRTGENHGVRCARAVQCVIVAAADLFNMLRIETPEFAVLVAEV